jgi:hypothetical protein
MNKKLFQNKVLEINKKIKNKSNYDIIKEIVYDICNIKNNNKKISWKNEIIDCIEYTYDSEEYDRKMNKIDLNLFYIPKNIRVLGDFEFIYRRYYLVNDDKQKESDNSKFKINFYL